MDTADATSREQAGANDEAPAAFYEKCTDRLEPDLDFIRSIRSQVGPSGKKCFQCGTCSSTCQISPDVDPFPRKEMAWAAWGLKDRLLKDPDVWLCHQCNDCTVRCPRGARPGDVLAAVRRECIAEYSAPRFLASWVRQPKFIPLLFAIPAALLTLALTVRVPLAEFLGFTGDSSETISYSFSSELPHWLINGFFGFFSLLVLFVIIVGVRRFWRAMKTTVPPERLANPAKPLGASIWATLKTLFQHKQFSKCGESGYRHPAHILVFFGFLTLCVVTFWVITSKINPLLDNFVYPWGFLNPWKILANVGGLSIVYGLWLMIRDRLRLKREGLSTYFDWSLIVLLLLVVLTGFGSEFMHFARMEPHRHGMYFFHLVFIFSLLMYMPYSKFAHIVYRATAMVFAEHTGRDIATPQPRPAAEPGDAEEVSG